MNPETALRLQSWVDGELPEAEARQVEQWVARDSEARAMADSLRGIRALLAEADSPRPVPESREFYWSRIERAIEAGESASPARPTDAGWRWLWRLLVPAGVVAALALLVVPALVRHQRGAFLSRAEIESALDDISSVSFRSESEGMTVVWICSN